ncbi:hypothetical protein ABKN59_006867 [Abortiporus biennis]
MPATNHFQYYLYPSPPPPISQASHTSSHPPALAPTPPNPYSGYNFPSTSSFSYRSTTSSVSQTRSTAQPSTPAEFHSHEANFSPAANTTPYADSATAELSISHSLSLPTQSYSYSSIGLFPPPVYPYFTPHSDPSLSNETIRTGAFQPLSNPSWLEDQWDQPTSTHQSLRLNTQQRSQSPSSAPSTSSRIPPQQSYSSFVASPTAVYSPSTARNMAVLPAYDSSSDSAQSPPLDARRTSVSQAVTFFPTPAATPSHPATSPMRQPIGSTSSQTMGFEASPDVPNSPPPPPQIQDQKDPVVPSIYVPPKENSTGEGKEKKHACWMCCKSFDRPSTLKKHMLVHTGERAHQCDTCGRRFGVASNLSRHVKRCVLRPVHGAAAIATSTTRHASTSSTSSSDIPPGVIPDMFVPENPAVPKTSARASRRRSSVEVVQDSTVVGDSSSSPEQQPQASTKPRRRRRAPSPSHWVPDSLKAFDLTPCIRIRINGLKKEILSMRVTRVLLVDLIILVRKYGRSVIGFLTPGLFAIWTGLSFLKSIWCLRGDGWDGIRVGKKHHR